MRQDFVLQTKCSLNWRNEGGNFHYSRDGYTVNNDILSAADELNSRPRKKLGYATPEELFDAFLDRVYSVGSKPA